MKPACATPFTLFCAARLTVRRLLDSAAVHSRFTIRSILLGLSCLGVSVAAWSTPEEIGIGSTLDQKKVPASIVPVEASLLTLGLSLEKAEYVRGESIPFTLTLANKGATPITLADASPANGAFSVTVTGTGGFKAAADTASILIREGEHIEQPRNAQSRTLKPGESLNCRGDLVSWIGDLGPGKYDLTARYNTVHLRILM